MRDSLSSNGGAPGNVTLPNPNPARLKTYNFKAMFRQPADGSIVEAGGRVQGVSILHATATVQGQLTQCPWECTGFIIQLVTSNLIVPDGVNLPQG